MDIGTDNMYTHKERSYANDRSAVISQTI